MDSMKEGPAATLYAILLLIMSQHMIIDIRAAESLERLNPEHERTTTGWEPVSLVSDKIDPQAGLTGARPVTDSLNADNKFQDWLEYIHRTSHSPLETADDNVVSIADSGSQSVGAQQHHDDSSDAEPTDPFDERDNNDHQTNSTDRNKFKPMMLITVAKDGSGDVRTVQAAVDRVPKNFNKRVVIRIKAGVYREKVRIHKDKPYITLLGEQLNRTIITYASTASDTWGKSNIPLRTYHSATVAVNSRFFIAKDITFQNTAPTPAPGAIGKQGVAFRISADMAAFYRCRFIGSQDTLYDHHGRHYFKNCYVEGTVDFVFGNGRSLYKNCHLNAVNNSGQIGSLTAQKRNETTLDTGFSFIDSSISGSGQVYLGRAWGNDSRVVFAYSYMDSVVLPVGWNDWGLPQRQKTAFYAEFNCTGPGAAKIGERVAWARVLTISEARPFLTSAFINGKSWLPRL